MALTCNMASMCQLWCTLNPALHRARPLAAQGHQQALPGAFTGEGTPNGIVIGCKSDCDASGDRGLVVTESTGERQAPPFIISEYVQESLLFSSYLEA